MSQVITGARGHIKLNGLIVGFVGGVNVTVEDTLTDVDVLGQLDVGDLAETAHKCNFSINIFKAVDGSNSAAALGFDTSFTSANGAVVTGDINTMRNQTAFNVDIVRDEGNSEVAFFTLVGCKSEGGTGQMDARGIWQGTWNFKATRGYGI